MGVGALHQGFFLPGHLRGDLFRSEGRHRFFCHSDDGILEAIFWASLMGDSVVPRSPTGVG